MPGVTAAQAATARCPACDLWRVATWADYVNSPDDAAAFCEGTVIGAWLNAAAGAWPGTARRETADGRR
jgi:hypothetical protein